MMSARTRTFTWQDPTETARQLATMRGLDVFRAMLAGEIPPPPIACLVDMDMTEAEEGRVAFEFEPQEFHYNPLNVVHGGIPSTLLDSAMSCAVQTVLPPGVGYTTLELKVNLVRPITTDTGRMHCVGQVLHVGRRTATAEGKLLDAVGKLYAHGTTTCMVFQPEAT